MSEWEWSLGQSWLTITIPDRTYHIKLDEVRFVEQRSATTRKKASVTIYLKAGDRIDFEGFVSEDLGKILFK